MQIAQQATPGFVLRPSLTLSILWGGVCCVWFVWVTLTLRMPPADQPQLLIFLPHMEYLAGSVINAALVLFLVVDFKVARQGPPRLKRGYMAGIVLAIVGIAIAQLAFSIAHRAVELG